MHYAFFCEVNSTINWIIKKKVCEKDDIEIRCKYFFFNSKFI